MAQSMYGSVNLHQMLGPFIQVGPNGEQWVNLLALQGEHFYKKQDGTLDFNVSLYITDEPNKGGFSGSLSIPLTKQQVAMNPKPPRQFIGSLRYSNNTQPQQQAAPVQGTTNTASHPWGGPPAQPTQPQQQNLPWQQPQQPASQPPAPQPGQWSAPPQYPSTTPVTQNDIKQGAGPNTGWKPVTNNPFP